MQKIFQFCTFKVQTTFSFPPLFFLIDMIITEIDFFLGVVCVNLFCRAGYKGSLSLIHSNRLSLAMSDKNKKDPFLYPVDDSYVIIRGFSPFLKPKQLKNALNFIHSFSSFSSSILLNIVLNLFEDALSFSLFLSF